MSGPTAEPRLRAPFLRLPQRFVRVPAVSTVSRYDTIDLARGLAAIAILFWHYQHFIVLGTATPCSRTGYPLYGLLRLFYEFGGMAVQFFWIVSGFIFTAVYHGRPVAARSFFLHRFARLYPLHIVTLILIVGLQYANRSVLGRDLLYPSDSFAAFAQQLVMASGWTPLPSFTFNGPVWSVSAEILVYAVFWAILPVLLRFGIAIPLCIAVVLRVALPSWAVAQCAFYFFSGVAIFAIRQALPLRAAFGVAVAFLAIGVGSIGLQMTGMAAFALFLGLTLVCATIDHTRHGALAARVPWVSDNCYGSYLLHIPIQLAMLLAIALAGGERAVAYSPYFLVLYLAIVTVVARMSFLFLERPARTYLRHRFARAEPQGEGATSF